jgi:hypothetical protein
MAKGYLSRHFVDLLRVVVELARCRDAAARLVRSEWGALAAVID